MVRLDILLFSGACLSEISVQQLKIIIERPFTFRIFPGALNPCLNESMKVLL